MIYYIVLYTIKGEWWTCTDSWSQRHLAIWPNVDRTRLETDVPP